MNENYVVFMVRVKDKYVERKSAQWVVYMMPESAYDSIIQIEKRKEKMKALFSNKAKYYKNIADHLQDPLLTDGIREAYETALEMVEDHVDQGRLVRMHGLQSAGEKRVYLFKLDDAVWEDSSYCNANPNVDLEKPPTAWYVGETILPIHERYRRHRSYDGEGRNISTKWGRTISLSLSMQHTMTWHSRFEPNSLELEAYRGVENLNYIEAKINELEFAEWLRSKATEPTRSKARQPISATLPEIDLGVPEIGFWGHVTARPYSQNP